VPDGEINTGGALELNSLSLVRAGSDVRLNWNAPYLDDGTGEPRAATTLAPRTGIAVAFIRIGETTAPTFLDTTSGTDAFEYEVTAEMR
jgi:hypothetical protein